MIWDLGREGKIITTSLLFLNLPWFAYMCLWLRTVSSSSLLCHVSFGMFGKLGHNVLWSYCIFCRISFYSSQHKTDLVMFELSNKHTSLKLQCYSMLLFLKS